MLQSPETDASKGKIMHRRTLLLFALFVVTAWFYSSVADDSSGVVSMTHQKQMKLLQEVENSFSSNHESQTEDDQG